MTDPISHFSRMAQMDNNVRQAARAERRQSAATGLAGDAPAPVAPKDDEVQLSAVARQAQSEPSFDQAKVEFIKYKMSKAAEAAEAMASTPPVQES